MKRAVKPRKAGKLKRSHDVFRRTRRRSETAVASKTNWLTIGSIRLKSLYVGI